MYHLNEKWDLRFLKLAREVSTWSKDPSTKTGAVLVRPDRSIISVGFNGFAPGIDDSPERYADRNLKIKTIIHCEENAVIFADRQKLQGSCLYTWPFISCAKCAGLMIRAGIKRVVAPEATSEKLERWAEDFKISREDFMAAGVEIKLYPQGILDNASTNKQAP